MCMYYSIKVPATQLPWNEDTPLIRTLCMHGSSCIEKCTKLPLRNEDTSLSNATAYFTAMKYISGTLKFNTVYYTFLGWTTSDIWTSCSDENFRNWAMAWFWTVYRSARWDDREPSMNWRLSTTMWRTPCLLTASDMVCVCVCVCGERERCVHVYVYCNG